MPEVVYVSHASVERGPGPVRIAHLPAEPQPVYFSVHGAIAKHYGLDPTKVKEPRAATLDYLVAAAGA